MPELHWHVLTLVDLGAARVLDTGWIWPVAVGLVLLFAAMLLCFGYAVERLMLRPLRRLQQSARAIANGSYDVSLPPGGQDEIGDLSNAFGVMADKVRQHTAELEQGARAHLGAGKRQPRHGRRAQEDRRLHRLRQPDPAGHPAGSPADPVAGRASLRAVEAARRGGRRFLRVPLRWRELPAGHHGLRRPRRAGRADDHAGARRHRPGDHRGRPVRSGRRADPHRQRDPRHACGRAIAEGAGDQYGRGAGIY